MIGLYISWLLISAFSTMASAIVDHIVVDGKKHIRIGEEFRCFLVGLIGSSGCHLLWEVFPGPYRVYFFLGVTVECASEVLRAQNSRRNSCSGLYGCNAGTQVPSRLLLLPPAGGTQLGTRGGRSLVLGAQSTRAQSRGENGSSEAVRETSKYPVQLS